MCPVRARPSRSRGRCWIAWAWAKLTMDRVLFGDNQFFGVNHMSEEKARAQAMRFQEGGAIIQVLEDAYAEGVKAFMCTTHERMTEICDFFRTHRDKYPDYVFY